MTISPALQKYMEYQQMAAQQQMQQPQMPQEQDASMQQPMMNARNPLGEGAMKGMEASRQSLEMNDLERKRAMGTAIMHFFGNMGTPQPGSGVAGALGSLNQGFIPAIQAYNAERNHIANQNYALMQQEEEKRKHQAIENLREREFMHEIEKQDAMNRYHQGLLALSRQRMDSISKEEAKIGRAEAKRQQLVGKGLLPEDSVLFDEIGDKELRKAKIKEMEKRKNALEPGKEAEQGVQKLLKIYRANPHLWRSGGRILEASLNKDETAFKNLAAGMSSKDIAAAQQIRKISQSIVFNTIKAFPGVKSVTIEKIIADTMTKASTHPDAAENILRDFSKSLSRQTKNNERAYHGWKHGAYVPEDFSDLMAPSEAESTPAMGSQNPYESMSTEELEARLLQLEGGQ